MAWMPEDRRIADELARLRAAAEEARHSPAPDEPADDLVRMGTRFLALSPEEGELVHILTRAAQAKRVVEFGASFGISAMYFAAALRHTGGTLVTTEVHPDKCAALRQTFADAGVEDIVTLLEGDARETLKEVEGPVDLVLLDGWKTMYLPVLEVLRPKLRDGALVIADNLNLEDAQPYVRYVEDPANGFLTQKSGKMGLSLYLG